MKILPINYCKFNSNKQASNKNINFEHHSDFAKLNDKYPVMVTVSSYFRRGGKYGMPSSDFSDIMHSLKLFFNKKMDISSDDRVQMLIGGIGNSQEPFSILAAIKYLIKEKKLKHVLDLYTVDLQSKPTRNTLFKQSFYDYVGMPAFVPSSFIEEDGRYYGLESWKKYRVNNDVFQYLLDVYNDPEKAQWESRLQEVIPKYRKNKFDIICVNNTLGYIEDKNLRIKTVKNIEKALKPGGVFITDTYSDYSDIFSPENADEIYKGIYQKRK